MTQVTQVEMTLSTVENRVETALYKCEIWMQKSMNCLPVQRKIFKYQWRLKKNLRDGLWHLNKRNTCEATDSLTGQSRGLNSDTQLTQLDERIQRALEVEFLRARNIPGKMS